MGATAAATAAPATAPEFVQPAQILNIFTTSRPRVDIKVSKVAPPTPWW